MKSQPHNFLLQYAGPGFNIYYTDYHCRLINRTNGTACPNMIFFIFLMRSLKKKAYQSFIISLSCCCKSFLPARIFLSACRSSVALHFTPFCSQPAAQHCEVLTGQSAAEGQTLASLSPHTQRRRWCNVRRRRVLAALHARHLRSPVTWPVLLFFILSNCMHFHPSSVPASWQPLNTESPVKNVAPTYQPEWRDVWRCGLDLHW